MPLIIIEGPSLELEARRKLVRELTEVASRAYGLPQEVITIVLHENEADRVASGGKLLIDLWAEKGKP